VSLKDFISPPAASELFTERTGTFTGNPVGAQYLNRFLRDIGSFNIGVPGGGNELGNNVGAEEKAAAAVASGALQAAQDGLGKDYNNDGAGNGFNVPSLLGLHQLPPYLHNGAAESLAQVVADARHRTDNGTLPDVLVDAAAQAFVVKFLESIDVSTAPFVAIEAHQSGNDIVLAFDSIAGVKYGVEAKDTLDAPWSLIITTPVGNGGRLDIPVPIDQAMRFLRLVEAP
jgi:hypothetical protein